jgi:hypothetical protein
VHAKEHLNSSKKGPFGVGFLTNSIKKSLAFEPGFFRLERKEQKHNGAQERFLWNGEGARKTDRQTSEANHLFARGRKLQSFPRNQVFDQEKTFPETQIGGAHY